MRFCTNEMPRVARRWIWPNVVVLQSKQADCLEMMFDADNSVLFWRVCPISVASAEAVSWASPMHDPRGGKSV